MAYSINPLKETYSQRLTYDVNNNPVYVGKAKAGSSESSGVWQIQKLTYDVNGNVTEIGFADGSSLFEHIWTNRESYSYS
jgi:YD repeat-containing protein